MTLAAAIFGTLALVLALVAGPVYLVLTGVAQALDQPRKYLAKGR